jgi:glycosyltransferase involved in cell wall biosynthesis
VADAPRLVQIAEFDRPHAGSFVPLLEGVLRRARDRGWRTDIVLPEAPGAEWVADLEKVAQLHSAPPSVLGSRITRARWLEAQFAGEAGPMVMHTHFTAWDVAAVVASRSPRVSRASVFWHIHSALPRSPSMVARGAAKFGILGRFADGIICPAPNIAMGVVQRLAPADRVHFMPSALNPALHPLASASDRVAARAQLELPEKAAVVLHFGWHSYLKGTDIFLEALARLVAEDPSVIGLVRGHEQSSERIAAELGLTEANIRFQEPVPDAGALFAAADVVVSSSREEGMAYTVLESLAAGTPVVATAIPGHAYLGEEVDACRLSNREPATLAAITREVLDLPSDQGEAEARAAHDWVVENLGVDVIADRLIELYEASPAFTGIELEDESPGRASMKARRSSEVRVIQVARFDNPVPGSFVPMLEQAAKSVTDSGWEPEIVLGSGSAGYPWAEALHERARVRFAPDVGRDGTRRWLRDLLEETDGPAILHTHFTSFDLSSAAATLGLDRAHTVWHVHSALSKDPSILLRNLVKFGTVGRAVDAMICPGPDLPDALVRRGAPRERIWFLPNGIDPLRFTVTATEARASARAALGVPEDAHLLLGFGWDWEVKGGEMFVRAAAAASEIAGPVYALHITGDARSEKLMASLALEGRAMEPIDDPTLLFDAADVFLATSRAEGTPFAVLEAIASGLPVVASDIPAHRFIGEHSSAVAVVPADPERFATAIAEALRAGPGPGDLPDVLTLSNWGERLREIYAAVLRA